MVILILSGACSRSYLFVACGDRSCRLLARLSNCLLCNNYLSAPTCTVTVDLHEKGQIIDSEHANGLFQLTFL